MWYVHVLYIPIPQAVPVFCIPFFSSLQTTKKCLFVRFVAKNSAEHQVAKIAAIDWTSGMFPTAVQRPPRAWDGSVWFETVGLTHSIYLSCCRSPACAHEYSCMEYQIEEWVDRALSFVEHVHFPKSLATDSIDGIDFEKQSTLHTTYYVLLSPIF